MFFFRLFSFKTFSKFITVEIRFDYPFAALPCCITTPGVCNYDTVNYLLQYCFSFSRLWVCMQKKNYHHHLSFTSWTETRQILAAQILRSDSTFWKMMSFETKWIAFFGAKSRCFLLRLCSPAKAIRLLARHYHSKTVRYGLQNDQTFLININTDYTSISNLRVLFLLCVAKSNVSTVLFQ